MVNTKHINKNGLSFDCPDYYDIGKYPSSDEAHKSMVALSKHDRECEIYITAYRKRAFDDNAKRNNYLLKEYLKRHGYSNIHENKNLPYCFNANMNHQIGNIKTTIVYNFDHKDVIMVVGNIRSSSNYDCIDDIKIILESLQQTTLIKNVKEKITSRNKTIFGFISIIWTLLFIPFFNMNFFLGLYFSYMPTVFPAIFLIIPSEKIKNSKILSILSIILILPFLIMNLHLSFDMITTLFDPTSYATFLGDIPYQIWITLYCLFNLFCAILLFIPTSSESKNNSQNVCKKCGNPLNNNASYCEDCGEKIESSSNSSLKYKLLFWNDEQQEYRISKTKLISWIIFLITGLISVINFMYDPTVNANLLGAIFLFIFVGLIFGGISFIIGLIFHHALKEDFNGDNSIKNHLLYCKDNNTNEIRLSKTKVISWIVAITSGILIDVHICLIPNSQGIYAENLIFSFFLFGVIFGVITYFIGKIVSKRLIKSIKSK